MLQNRLLYFILSIFFTLNIFGFKTDEPKPGFKICDTKPGKISKTHLLQNFDDCNRLSYYNAEGEQFEIKKFTIGILSKSAYFEVTHGNMLTVHTKEKLEKTPVGTELVFANITVEKNGAERIISNQHFILSE